MKAMILAAGRGERMRPLTDARPKPLLEAGGRPLLDYHLAALVAAGIRDIVINVAWHGDLIRRHVGDGSRFGARVRISDEGPEALETGGGIRHALPLLGRQPFWVVNGDVWCAYPFAVRGLPDGIDAHLVMVPNPAHHPAGDFCVEGGRLRPRGTPRLTYSGLGVFRPGLFAACDEGRFPLAPLLVAAMERERVSGERFGGYWTDVGTPERLASLDARLSA